MRRIAPIALIAPLLLVACGGGQDFEADYAAAKANIAGGPGKAYDTAVGEAIHTDAVATAVLVCARDNRELLDGKYRGVMRFGDDGGYTIEMQPDDALAQCLVAAYSNRTVPEPPARPYLLPLDFDAPPPR